MKGPGFESWQEHWLFSKTSGLALGPTRPPVQSVSGLLAGCKATGAWDWTATSYLYYHYPITGPRRPRREVELQLYSFFNLGARWEWEVSVTPRPLYPREIDSVFMIQKPGWTRGPVWTACPQRVPIPGPSSLWRVNIPNELSWPSCSVQVKRVWSCTYNSPIYLHALMKTTFHLLMEINWTETNVTSFLRHSLCSCLEGMRKSVKIATHDGRYQDYGGVLLILTAKFRSLFT
jgi:hypothetical protein